MKKFFLLIAICSFVKISYGMKELSILGGPNEQIIYRIPIGLQFFAPYKVKSIFGNMNETYTLKLQQFFAGPPLNDQGEPLVSINLT